MESTQFRRLAEEITREAGELARRRREEGVRLAATKSTLADIVTEADREVEQRIRDLLAASRPDDGFLGEESGASVSDSGYTWVVDPIDGTVNYAYGVPDYAVSIALVRGEPDPQHWQILAGAVLNPATGELFSAALGEGASLNGSPIRVSAEIGGAGALLGTGFGYSPERRREQFAVLEQVLPLVRDIRRRGAASLDLAGVACGRLDAYYERGLWPWDMAAGLLLVTEAGGRVGGLRGERPDRNLVIASAPTFFDQLDRALASASPGAVEH